MEVALLTESQGNEGEYNRKGQIIWIHGEKLTRPSLKLNKNQ